MTITDLQKKGIYEANDRKSELDQQTILGLRERVAALERALEVCEQEKNVLECRIEQRHLQVGLRCGGYTQLNFSRDVYNSLQLVFIFLLRFHKNNICFNYKKFWYYFFDLKISHQDKNIRCISFAFFFLILVYFDMK